MSRYFKKTALILPDIHVPFQHKKIIKNIISLIRSTNPTKIVLLGDFLDCYSISRFDKQPHRAEDFHYELTCDQEILEKFHSASPETEIEFIEGNHCARLQKMLDSNMRAFRNLPNFDIENLLSLDKYNATYHKKHYFLNSNFICTHGFHCNVRGAAKELDKYGVNGISGHRHRLDYAYKGHAITNKEKEWFSIGTLADISQLTYAENFNHDWSNSFAIVEYNRSNYDVTVISCDKKTGSFYNPIEGKYYGKI